MVQIANDIQLNFTNDKFELSQNKIDYIDIVELTIEEAEKLAYEIDQKIRCLKSLNKGWKFV